MLRRTQLLVGLPTSRAPLEPSAVLHMMLQLGEARRAELRLQWSESLDQRAIEQRVANLLRDHGFAAYSAEVKEAIRSLLESTAGLTGEP